MEFFKILNGFREMCGRSHEEANARGEAFCGYCGEQTFLGTKFRAEDCGVVVFTNGVKPLLRMEIPGGHFLGHSDSRGH